jgi:hypothetical protein
MGGWVGPGAGLDALVKRKIPSPFTALTIDTVFRFTTDSQGNRTIGLI